MSDTEQLAKLRELAEKATPGPWEVVPSERDGHVTAFVQQVGGGRIARVWDARTHMLDNGAFIAEARTALPALLTMLEEREKERDNSQGTPIAYQCTNCGVVRWRQFEACVCGAATWQHPGTTWTQLQHLKEELEEADDLAARERAEITSRALEAEARASRAEQATDEAVMKERDDYHDWADKLADAISEKFGVPIGEHSNMNCPWAVALGILNGEYVTAAESSLAAERGRVTKLEQALTYLIEVRNIKCMHAHPGPDDLCAKCIADKLLATEERTTP